MNDNPKTFDVLMSQKERSETRWLNTVSMVILATVALAFALVFTRKVMIPFVLALFMVSMVSPILDFLVIKWRFPRVLAVLISLVFVLAIAILIGFLVTGAVLSVVNTAQGYSQSVVNLVGQGLDWLDMRYPSLKLTESAEYQKILNDMGKRILLFIQGTVGTVLGLISSTLFVTIITVFLLAGRNPHLIRRGMAAEVDHKIRRYIVTKVGISAVTGILVWVILRLIGLKLAGVFGMLAFLLNFIPSVGSIISTLLPLPVAFAQFPDSVGSIAMVIVIPGVLQMLIGNVVDPKLMGEGLNLHPVTVLLALAFWGLLWGVAGMFLAAPMTAVVRIVCMQFEMLAPLAELMAGRIPDFLQRDKV